MPLSINHNTKVISVPQSYLTPLTSDVYELDVAQFKLDINDLLDDPDNMALVDIIRHNTEVTLGGVTLARTVEFINGYTIEFEDGQYAVTLTGANNNIADVMVVNQVSLRSNNSAGLIVTGAGDPNTVADAIFNYTAEGSLNFKDVVRLIMATLLGKVSGAGTTTITFRNTPDSKDRVVATVDEIGNRSAVSLDPSD